MRSVGCWIQGIQLLERRKLTKFIYKGDFKHENKENEHEGNDDNFKKL